MDRHDVLGTIWTHKVPLAFLAGAIGVAATSAVDLLTQFDSPIIGAPWGFAAAAAYLVIGAVYEWTIREEQRFNREYQETKEALNEYDDNDV